jgi:hypothetical protein
LIWGRSKPAEESCKEAYEISRDFLGQFKGKFGTELCTELIGDLLRANKCDSDERRQRCFDYSLNAIRICIDILSKYKKI